MSMRLPVLPTSQACPDSSSPASKDGAVVPFARDFEADFVSTFERSAARMVAVAIRYLRNEADAHEAVQDAFVAAYRNRNAFAGTSSLGTWIHRILINVCLMRLRSKARRPVVSLETLDAGMRRGEVVVDSSADDPAHETARNSELLQRVREAMRNLPERHRTILQLRAFEGFSTSQTAELLGISEDAVKTRLCRARHALQELLDEVTTAIGPRSLIGFSERGEIR